MKIIKNKLMQEGAVLLALAGYLLWYSLDGYAQAFNKDWSQSPFLFPVVVAIVLFVLSFLLFGQGIHGLRAETAEGKKEQQSGALRRTAIVIALCLLYYGALRLGSLPYLAVSLFGLTLRFSTFELATFVFLVAMMLFLSVRNKKILVLVPLGTVLFLSVMFRSLLHVILP